MNSNNLLPSIQIYGEEEDSGELYDNFTTTSEAFMWIIQTTLDWQPQITDVSDPSNSFSFTLPNLKTRYQDIEGSTRALTKLKKKYIKACMKIAQSFGLADFGFMYRTPICMKSEPSTHLIQIITIKKDSILNDDLKAMKFSWRSSGKLDSVYHKEHAFIWNGYLDIYKQAMHFISSGLYLALFNCVVTAQGPSNYLL